MARCPISKNNFKIIVRKLNTFVTIFLLEESSKTEQTICKIYFIQIYFKFIYLIVWI